MEGHCFGNISSGFVSGKDMASLFHQLLDNPLLFGGLGVTLLGMLGFIIRWLYGVGTNAFNQYFMHNLEIAGDNVAYDWALEHIHSNSSWKTKNLSVESTLAYDKTGNGYVTHNFLPGKGVHYFYYNKQLVQMSRNAKEANTGISRAAFWRTNDEKKDEKILLTTFGGSPKFWTSFLDDACKKGIETKKLGLSIHQFVQGSHWQTFGGSRNKRSLESVVLAEGVVESLQSDIDEFLDSEEWYRAVGIPYRRGYLLYGPPGTGKTSIIWALASHFGFNVCLISLSNVNMNDQTLALAFITAPKRSFILLEDIDSAFANREQEEDQTDVKAIKKASR